MGVNPREQGRVHYIHQYPVNKHGAWNAPYNLGVVQELAEKYDAAQKAFNFYLFTQSKRCGKARSAGPHLRAIRQAQTFESEVITINYTDEGMQNRKHQQGRVHSMHQGARSAPYIRQIHGAWNAPY